MKDKSCNNYYFFLNFGNEAGVHLFIKQDIKKVRILLSSRTVGLSQKA